MLMRCGQDVVLVALYPPRAKCDIPLTVLPLLSSPWRVTTSARALVGSLKRRRSSLSLLYTVDKDRGGGSVCV